MRLKYIALLIMTLWTCPAGASWVSHHLPKKNHPIPPSPQLRKPAPINYGAARKATEDASKAAANAVMASTHAVLAGGAGGTSEGDKGHSNGRYLPGGPPKTYDIPKPYNGPSVGPLKPTVDGCSDPDKCLSPGETRPDGDGPTKEEMDNSQPVETPDVADEKIKRPKP